MRKRVFFSSNLFERLFLKARFFLWILTMLHQFSMVLPLAQRDWKKRKKANAEKKPFSTLFKVNIYENNQGVPGKPLTYESIVFRATEKNGDVFNLDLTPYDVYIPKTGVFISLQVLGYTDKAGKLLPNKKYKEIKSRGNTVRIPTNFRPLLPFTDQISENNTFIKRVFLNNNQWIPFKQGHIKDSSLLSAGLNNYGMGISFRVYKDE